MKKRILVVEDNNDLADFMRRLLRGLGYEVLLAADGVEAMERALAGQPDLIVMDMMMPRMGGFQAARQLRLHPETKTVPILAALTSPENREKCMVSGCDDHLAKPFAPKQLADAVERLLQRK